LQGTGKLAKVQGVSVVELHFIVIQIWWIFSSNTAPAELQKSSVYQPVSIPILVHSLMQMQGQIRMRINSIGYYLTNLRWAISVAEGRDVEENIFAAFTGHDKTESLLVIP